jgi:tripartite-type tricarboxylate transporter receptor subunit TctC
VRQKFDQSGNFAVSSTPEEFEAFIRKEANRWSKVLADLDIKYD